MDANGDGVITKNEFIMAIMQMRPTWDELMSGDDDWNTGMNDTSDWNTGMNDTSDWNTGMNDTSDWNTAMNGSNFTNGYLVSTDICDFNLDTVVSADEQDNCYNLTEEWNTTISNGSDAVPVTSSVWANTDGLALQVMDYNLDGYITYTEWLWFQQLMYSWNNMDNGTGQTDETTILSNKYRMFNQNYIFNYT